MQVFAGATKPPLGCALTRLCRSDREQPDIYGAKRAMACEPGVLDGFVNSQLLSLRSLLMSIGSIQLATAALGTIVALQISATGGSQETASLVAVSYSLGFLVGCFRIATPLARVGHIRAFAAAAALCTTPTRSS